MQTVAQREQDSWFYEFAGNRIGPLAPHEIRAAIGAGRILPDTPLRQLSSSHWQRAGDSFFAPFFTGGPIDSALAVATTVNVSPPSLRPGEELPASGRIPPSARMPLRLTAGVLDWVIFSTLYCVALTALALILSVFSAVNIWRTLQTNARADWSEGLRRSTDTLVAALPGQLLTLAIYSLFVYLGYFVLIPLLTGSTTFGKRGCGLLVVDRDGGPASSSQLILRAVALLGTGVIPGVASAILHPGHRGLHDVIARTQVVPEQESKNERPSG